MFSGMVCINFSRPKKSVANEANLFCVVGQDIFVSALFDGLNDIAVPWIDLLLLFLDHGTCTSPIVPSPIIETFSLATIPTRFQIQPHSQTNCEASA